LQYGLTEGFPPLRDLIAEYVRDEGIPATRASVIITSGSQQALDLAGRVFLNEGDTVLVENPTFLGALQSFNAYGVRYAPIPVDEEGICVNALERTLQRMRPKLMYLIPTFQNPTGVTMSLARREKVLDLAEAYRVPILEDNPYGPLRFEGEALPSLAALDARRNPVPAGAPNDRSTVLYLGTFSKLLCPGFRLAWVVCPPEVAGQFVMAKQGADLHSNTLAQTIAFEFMRRGWLPPQIARIRDTYRERRDAMCDAIVEYFPPSVRYTRPEGGLFLWLTLPEGVDTVGLLKEAAQYQVAFVPGGPFFVDGTGQNTLRLSFAAIPPETIREGIRRLAMVIKHHLL
jgi:2-aminoadipate transaminase